MGWGEPQGGDGAARLAPVPLDAAPPTPHPPGLRTFRAGDWEGADPRVGDVLVVGELYQLTSVTRGPTIGQFTLEAIPTLEVPARAGVHRWRA